VKIGAVENILYLRGSMKFRTIFQILQPISLSLLKKTPTVYLVTGVSFMKIATV